jgi:hypothetical protein
MRIRISMLVLVLSNLGCIYWGRMICLDRQLYIVNAKDNRINVCLTNYKNKYYYKRNAFDKYMDCSKFIAIPPEKIGKEKGIISATVVDNLFNPKLFEFSVNDTSIVQIDSINIWGGNAEIYLKCKKDGKVYIKAVSDKLSLEFTSDFNVKNGKVVKPF